MHTTSPPPGPRPGHCEAPAVGHSYRQRVRDAVAVLCQRYGRVRIAAACLIIAGLFGAAAIQIGNSAYILAKAQLAQFLIASAWSENLDRGTALKRPWPWADMRPLARIEFPRLQAARYVLDDDSGRTLAFGPGFRPDSALPGQGGNTVISAHRDTHFALLRNIQQGDVIRLQTVNGQLAMYQVDKLQVVDQHDLWVAADHGIDELTLVTCWPFDALTPQGPERLVVSASRLYPVARQAAELRNAPGHFRSAGQS